MRNTQVQRFSSLSLVTLRLNICQNSLFFVWNYPWSPQIFQCLPHSMKLIHSFPGLSLVHVPVLTSRLTQCVAIPLANTVVLTSVMADIQCSGVSCKMSLKLYCSGTCWVRIKLCEPSNTMQLKTHKLAMSQYEDRGNASFWIYGLYINNKGFLGSLKHLRDLRATAMGTQCTVWQATC